MTTHKDGVVSVRSPSAHCIKGQSADQLSQTLLICKARRPKQRKMYYMQWQAHTQLWIRHWCFAFSSSSSADCQGKMKHQSFPLSLSAATCLPFPFSSFVATSLSSFPLCSVSALLFSGFTSVIFAHSHCCFSAAFACMGVSSFKNSPFAALQTLRARDKLLGSFVFLRLTWQPLSLIFCIDHLN